MTDIIIDTIAVTGSKHIEKKNIGKSDSVDVYLNKKSILSMAEMSLYFGGKDSDYSSDDESDHDIEASRYCSTADLLEHLQGEIGDGEKDKRVRILSLKGTGLTDDAFLEVTDKLIARFSPGIEILDLSFNELTAGCVCSIMRWVNDAKVNFINVDGNCRCCMKYIRDLCFSLESLLNGELRTVQAAMEHIIFMPKYYIYHAVNKVKMYNNLCNEGYLTSNWAERHKEYYLLISSGKCTFPEVILSKSPEEDEDKGTSYGIIGWFRCNFLTSITTFWVLFLTLFE